MSEAAQAAVTPLPFGATVTILFSDIRGFTEYTSQYGDEAAFRVLREHNAVVRRQIELYGGHVVKTQGDNFMVSFTTARGAILCAVAIQRAIAGAEHAAEGPRIAVGIGINTGEPIQQGGDYFGTTVNLAARLCAAAGPGQILVSETTRYVAGRVDDVAYIDRGLHDLKGFLEPQRLYEVRWKIGPGEAADEDGEAEGGALEGAVQRAMGVLTRVLSITHQDNAAFGPLLECQARASDLRLQLSRALAERRGYTVRKVDEAMLPFADLLMLVDSREPLDDQRWSEIEASVARVFGRELAVAATRGKLTSDGPGRRREPAPAATAALPPVPPPPTVQKASPTLTPASPPAGLDPRAEAVTWWASAHRAWTEWKSSGMAWAHALRAALARYPHLLAVPITESARHGAGDLAAGYFLLLEHVENRSPAFLRTAVDRAISVAAAAGAAPDAEGLSRALYELMVQSGRLGETYVDFVADVMVATIPNPGVWMDGGITESDDATVVKRRPDSTPGDDGEAAERFTDPAARAAEHRFAIVLAPLTARFYFVKGQLKQPHDVDLHVREDGAPSDRACYLTLRTGHLLHTEPRRIGTDGVRLDGLGRDFAGVWVGLFNPDAHAAIRAELGITLRAPVSPLGRRSPFSGLGRNPR
jgi:class 3 adenylate cyclase